MNTYQVEIFPEGWNPSSPVPPYHVVAAQFTTTEDYVVFIDESNPPQGIMMVPFSLNPLVTRMVVAP